MKFVGMMVASLALVAGLSGCEPAYPFKGRGYTPPSETSYAYTSDEHVYRGSAKRAAG